MLRTVQCMIMVLILLILILPAEGALLAQDEGLVQIINGSIGRGEYYWYTLPELEKGQALSIHLRGTSGNLDPIMGLVGDGSAPDLVRQQYTEMIEAARDAGADPLMAMQNAADEQFLVWNDDGGSGLAAQIAYEVPEDGDYQLIVSSALTVLGRETTGDYELVIGLDAPELDAGSAESTGDSIAVLNHEASSAGIAVEEIEGRITIDNREDTYELRDVRPGDTISVYIEAVSGDLQPSLVLLNYADKPVATANMNGGGVNTSLAHIVDDRGRGFAVRVSACCEDESATGEYRLLVGVNTVEVLTGEARHSDEGIIKEPIAVAIGIKLQQIIEVDEQNEFFTAAASLQMEWDDQALAFSPDECHCTFKTYSDANFSQFIADSEDRWPDFTLFNQQGNRWTQNRNLVVWQDGHALYFERFTTNLQVDFDFRKYPFDEEEFSIHVDAIFPEDFYYFTDLEGYSEISADNGEDEFMIGDFETTVTSEQASTKATISRFTFSFGGPRHVNYFIIQVFVPILLILTVLWVTFFLRDYALRIEVAGANLLVFIAFSFSLADNYPRLGYVTLLDAVMLITFVISTLVIVYNVYLRRLEMSGQGEMANNIDNVLDWGYPITILGSAIVLYFIFF